MTIGELREKVQTPRRPYDTLYGRTVMRSFSVYLTAFFSRFRFVTPFSVTLLSVLAGLAGSASWYQGKWIQGAVLLNLWYLLDHVDGELARLRGQTSLTGFYFDTVANALVMPISYAALGVGLGVPLHGISAAYGTLMLFVIVYCESAVVMNWAGPVQASEASPTSRSRSSPFTWVHRFFSYPVFLPLVTVCAIAGMPLDRLLYVYAAGLNVIWMAVLTRTLAARKLETQYPSVTKK